MKKRCGSMLLEVSIGLVLLVAVSASLSMLTKTLSGGRASIKSLVSQRLDVESAAERLAVVEYGELKVLAHELKTSEPIQVTLVPFTIANKTGTQVTLAANDYPGIELKLWRFSDMETENDGGE